MQKIESAHIYLTVEYFMCLGLQNTWNQIIFNLANIFKVIAHKTKESETIIKIFHICHWYYCK